MAVGERQVGAWNVLRLFAALAGTVSLGLLSRLHPIGWQFYDKSLGDALYAVAVYLALALLLYRRPLLVVATLALAICLAVESFQATGIPARFAYLSVVRWFVGTTFAWHDVLCYIVGVLVIVAVDWLILRPVHRHVSSKSVSGREPETTAPNEHASPSSSIFGSRETDMHREMFAAFEVFGELTRDATGITYKARDRSVGRCVANKLLASGTGASSIERQQRFLREARVMAAVDHPHVIHVLQVGEDQGIPFIVMELAEGGTLASQLNGTPWQPGRAARLIQTVALALHAVHTSGVVHRDVKPANIMLTLDGNPKLTGFGRCTLLGQPSQMAIGTPSYMPPEQAKPNGEPIGAPADIYSLGTTMYELLTGRLPFVAENTARLLELAANESPLPLRQLQPGIPVGLEAICLKCLMKRPSERFASAKILADELNSFLLDS